MKIVSTVVKSLPEEEQAEFTKRCIANADLFNTFADVFARKQHDSYTSAMKLDKFEMASWAHYQADQQGYQRAMAEVPAILNFNKD